MVETDEIPQQDALPASSSSTIVTKWQEAGLAGFQPIPDVLFRVQSRLGLDAVDVVVLLNITMHWWESDDLPHPTPAVIARRMGLTTRAVEKRLASLEERGFIKRGPKERTGRGRYANLAIRRIDPTGFVERLRPFGRRHLEWRADNLPKGDLP